VILEVAPEYQTDPSMLARIHVRASNGKLIPLDTVTQVRRSTEALTINHQGQLPSVTISFNLHARRFARRGGRPHQGARTANCACRRR
jgi:HAE1 family hydrophobic/amphiphilic exporter-1